MSAANMMERITCANYGSGGWTIGSIESEKGVPMIPAMTRRRCTEQQPISNIEHAVSYNWLTIFMTGVFITFVIRIN